MSERIKLEKNYPRCLVLNTNNQILSITPWIRALSLLRRETYSKNTVSVLGWYDGTIISSEKEKFRIPCVLRLNYYVKIHSKKMERNFNYPSLKNLLIRDNFTCQYCGKKLTFKNATKDHLIPLSKGGKNTIDNVVSSCKECNSLKANLSLEEFEKRYNRKLMQRPRFLTEEEKIKVIFKFFKNKEKKQWLKCLKNEGIELW